MPGWMDSDEGRDYYIEWQGGREPYQDINNIQYLFSHLNISIINLLCYHFNVLVLMLLRLCFFPSVFCVKEGP